MCSKTRAMCEWVLLSNWTLAIILQQVHHVHEIWHDVSFNKAIKPYFLRIGITFELKSHCGPLKISTELSPWCSLKVWNTWKDVFQSLHFAVMYLQILKSKQQTLDGEWWKSAGSRSRALPLAVLSTQQHLPAAWLCTLIWLHMEPPSPIVLTTLSFYTVESNTLVITACY